ncbi:MAG: hypothetical protein LBR55_00580, partial [Bacteroidales bacterium]|nr:hypothetical protein [Bacteroidales bacterium]
MKYKIFLSAIIGIVFAVSAVLKLFSVNLFIVSIVDTSFVTWNFAPFVAYLLIAVELFLGILLVTTCYLPRGIALKATLLLLIVFTVHLMYILATQGNQTNCMCMGSEIFLTPLQSIIKNVLLLAGIVVLLRNYRSMPAQRYAVWIVTFGAVVSVGFPVMSAALNFSNTTTEKPVAADWHPIQAAQTNSHIDFSAGKHIVLFASTQCKHCKIAAYKMSVFLKKNPTLPVFLVITGSESDVVEFRHTHDIEPVPYVTLSPLY